MDDTESEKRQLDSRLKLISNIYYIICDRFISG